ncbi:MAG: hypothetical protein AAGF12_33280 [Myxococcota bacterium]
MRFAFVLLAVSAIGCSDAETRPPPPPPGGEGGTQLPPPGGGRRDASMDAAADADATDSGLPPGCEVVGPARANVLDIRDATGAAVGSPITRAYAAWLDGEGCEDPRLAIGLSQGTCDPDVDDNQLVFRIDRDELGDLTAPYTVEEPVPGDPVEVRLFLRRTGPTESFGNCAGSSGLLTFGETGRNAGDPQSASFEMTLSDCTDGFEQLSVIGSFEVTLRESFGDACP